MRTDAHVSRGDKTMRERKETEFEMGICMNGLSRWWVKENGDDEWNPHMIQTHEDKFNMQCFTINDGTAAVDE